MEHGIAERTATTSTCLTEKTGRSTDCGVVRGWSCGRLRKTRIAQMTTAQFPGLASLRRMADESPEKRSFKSFFKSVLSAVQSLPTLVSGIALLVAGAVVVWAFVEKVGGHHASLKAWVAALIGLGLVLAGFALAAVLFRLVSAVRAFILWRSPQAELINKITNFCQKVSSDESGNPVSDTRINQANSILREARGRWPDEITLSDLPDQSGETFSRDLVDQLDALKAEIEDA